MPYKAARDDRCPAAKPWGVTKSTDGELMGCHASEEDAMSQVQAILANEPEARDEPIDETPTDTEIRSFDGVLEFRDSDEALTFTGHAAVWNAPSRPLPFIERFQPGAFARSLRSRHNIRLLVDHNPERLLASTRAKTLTLAEDDHGLRVEADLAPTSYGRDLKVLADRKEISSMSFAFKPSKGGESWSPDGQARTVTEARLFEVSILTGHDPAYETTTAFIRSLAQRLETAESHLAGAVLALAEGRELDDYDHQILREAIAALRPAEPAVPLAVFRRQLVLNAKRPY